MESISRSCGKACRNLVWLKGPGDHRRGAVVAHRRVANRILRLYRWPQSDPGCILLFEANISANKSFQDPPRGNLEAGDLKRGVHRCLPAFLAHANTVSLQHVFYCDHIILWLGPSETARVSIEALWQGTAPPHKAALKVGIWNTTIWETDSPVSDVAPRWELRSFHTLLSRTCFCRSNIGSLRAEIKKAQRSLWI